MNCNDCGKPRATYVEYDVHNFNNQNECPTKPCPYCSTFCWSDETGDTTCDGVVIDWRARCLAAEAKNNQLKAEMERLKGAWQDAQDAQARCVDLIIERDQLKRDLAEALDMLDSNGGFHEWHRHLRPRLAELRKRAVI